MNPFFELVRFEFKKTMCRKRTVIVLALVIILGAVSVFGTVSGNYYYTDENGNEIAVSRYDDDMIDRKNGEALSGRVIDADLIVGVRPTGFIISRRPPSFCRKKPPRLSGILNRGDLYGVGIYIIEVLLIVKPLFKRSLIGVGERRGLIVGYILNAE